MKAIQTLFQSILFISSFFALLSIFYKLLITNYSSENFIAILIFMFPILLSFIFSGSLLIKK